MGSDGPGEAPPARQNRGFQPPFHPRSGMIVLALDWLLFGSNMLTSLVATSVIMLVGFTLAVITVYPLQRRLHGRWRALLETLVAAALVAIPTPIAGTAAGTLMLALSGGDRRAKLRGRDPAKTDRDV